MIFEFKSYVKSPLNSDITSYFKYMAKAAVSRDISNGRYARFMDRLLTLGFDKAGAKNAIFDIIDSARVSKGDGTLVIRTIDSPVGNGLTVNGLLQLARFGSLDVKGIKLLDDAFRFAALFL